MFCAIHRHCYHFAQRTLFKKKTKKNNFSHVKDVRRNVVSNNLSEIVLFDLAHLCKLLTVVSKRTRPQTRCVLIALPACCNGHFDKLGAAV